MSDKLSLRPVVPVIQRVAVYETRAKLYVVGSTNDGKSCRMLKIDRTMHPSGDLAIEEDEKEYQQSEIQQTLVMLDGANQNSTTRYRSGLQQVASAFGIVGFIRFLEGWYIILVTKRKPMATIGGHILYKVEDTEIHPVNPVGGRPVHPDEARYLKIFHNVDLHSNYYFSYSYDLTHSLQCQMRTYPGPAPPSCRKFVWNDHLLRYFEGFVHSRWILHFVCGFISQINISVFGRPIFLTLIARRSRLFAGTRFLKRGSNDEGNVANEVETEQIVHDASSNLHPSGRYTSFLQLRGSVPAFWSQDITSMRPKPQITIDRATPFATPAALHFAACLKRFGSPIICLNLVKAREKRLHEALLTKELLASVEYLNQFLPPEHHIQYVHCDMARIHKRNKGLIEILEQEAEQGIRKTGFFHSGPELFCNIINPNPNYQRIGGYGYQKGYIGRDQTGVVRVNCVDCLDRTNTAQFIMGKCALGYQLYCLGVLEEPHVPFDCDTVMLLEEAYEDHGDSLAVQYGGSSLVHRIQTYRKVGVMKSHGRDIYQTTLRYYRNAFTDTDKQNAINLFLGMFVPREGEPNLWELPTDYYLHHVLARVPTHPRTSFSHTKWWKDRLIASLPLPQLEVEDEEDVKQGKRGDKRKTQPSLKEGERDAKQGTAPEGEKNRKEEMAVDTFDEVYRTYELTDFDRLLSRAIARTGDNTTYLNDSSTSPFVVRDKQKKKTGSKSVAERVTSVGIPKSAAEQDVEDDDSDTDEDDWLTVLPSSSESSNAPRPSSSTHSELQLTSCKDHYGFELHPPSKHDQDMYQKYALIYNLSCKPPTGKKILTSAQAYKESTLWQPLGDYGSDSVFSVKPPTVPKESLRIYQQSLNVARYGPVEPSPEDLKCYKRHAQQDENSMT